MDMLLTLIEESVTWKGALGFDKGAVNDPTPTGKGKSFIQHCGDIAKAFFLGNDVDFDFTKDDLPVLKTVIKNRIHRYVNILSPWIFTHRYIYQSQVYIH